MKTNYLFPHRLKRMAGALFILSAALLIGIFASDYLEESLNFTATTFAIIDSGFKGGTVYFGLTENQLLDELLIIIVIISGLVFAFSKEKHEDEMVSSIRLHSLAWATIANYAILLFCYLFIFGLPFLSVLMGAMFSQLVIFIALFRFKMYRFYNSRQDEE